ncbi:MAG TPA: DUF882 domain-containing protein [Vicinamibacterales bacterium]|nr:DUF882 domain-containing protein [Vicinamibacterales bacterium]
MENHERRHSFDRRHGDRRHSADRRRFIQIGAAAAAVVVIPSRLKAVSPPAPVAPPAVAAAAKTAPAMALRELAFVHTHTAEKMAIAYAVNGQYQAEALAKLNHLLRDFRTGEEKPIDPKLFDLLHELTVALGNDAPFHVISGYRSPHTNTMLRSRGGGGVATMSLHMVGKAMDIRVPDVKLKTLREAAADLKRGGVGYYPSSNFVHVDTGRVRYW